MYKQILFYLMLIDSVSRATAIVLLAALEKISLPFVIIVISALVAALGIGLVIKRMIKNIWLWELGLYHGVSILAVILSFVLLRFFPADVSMVETVITGSVLTVLFSGTFLVLAFRRKRHITAQRRLQQLAEKQQQEETLSSQK